MQTRETIKHLSNSNGIKPRWVINDAIHGASIIDPRSLRYYRNQSHPYGWQVSFRCSLILLDGTRKSASFSALGTDRRAAMANALPR
jgi:hypothetical protein